MSKVYGKSEDSTLHFTGSLLTRNVLYNIMGQVLPIFVAIVCIPFIVRGLGIDRFGVLTLAWMVVGYFSLFDMGIGRATTKFVAEHIGSGKEDALPSLIWTSMTMLAGFGLLGGLTVAALTPLLVNNLLKIPTDLASEAMKTFYLLAISIPFVLGTAGSRGVLEAQQKFGLVNSVKIPASAANFLSPLVVMLFSKSLFPIVAFLTVTRSVVFLVYFYLCINSIKGLRRPSRPSMIYFKQFLSFGGWLTVSNIVGPFMAYMDRFLVGILVGMSAVAYYATPYDLVTKLWIISGSLMGVLFPAFSAYSNFYKEKLGSMFESAVKFIFIVLVPIVFLIIMMAGPFLESWLGKEFSEHSMLVMQILSLGVLICAISQVPYSAIQACGRSDITAKLHLFELPIYLTMVWLLITEFGIVGAALAWLFRILIDTVLLFRFFYNMMPTFQGQRGRLLMYIVIVIVAICGSAYITALVPGILFKFFVYSFSVLLFIMYSWKLLLDQEKLKLSSLLCKLYGVTK